MIELVTTEPTEKVIKMGEMQPYDIGVIQEGDYSGDVVMRTASLEFQVMSLSDPWVGHSWNNAKCSLMVTLLKSGSVVKLVVK